MPEKKWYEKSRRRHLLDFHIDDWSPEFMSEFDHAKIADLVVTLGATAGTVFANTHTGLCNWPTKSGEEHHCLKGKDAFGTMVNNLHQRGLAAICYYCLIYTDWYWETHPEARTVDVDGNADKVYIASFGQPRRFSIVCHNNPQYREWVVLQIKELCDGYDFEGVWSDMTWWPAVCYCDSCRQRYRKESGEEIPVIVNWQDPKWVRFQRTRQKWLIEFVQLVTDTFKKYKPGVSVAHQSGSYINNWLMGVSSELAEHTDWLSADLYRDKSEMAVISKLFNNLSNIKPYEHINCWYYPNIHEHTIARTEYSLKCTAFSALANDGALMLIDAIDPRGTVNPKNYYSAAGVFKELALYENYGGGKFLQDIGIYYSFDSNFDPEIKPHRVPIYEKLFMEREHTQQSHLRLARDMGAAMLENHIPFGLVTRKSLGELNRYQVIVLPNVVMMSEQEMHAIRKYVKDGGSVFATKKTSLISIDGESQANFMLADLFGVDYVGETYDNVTYVSPTQQAEIDFEGFDAKWPPTLYTSQVIVRPNKAVDIRAQITLPYTHNWETRFASLLAEPPGEYTDKPSIVVSQYGKGKVLYSAGAIETWSHERLRKTLANLATSLVAKPLHYYTDAPKSVEITLFDQSENKRLVVNLINYQAQLPNIPVYGIKVRINLEGRKVVMLQQVPNLNQVDYMIEDDFIEFVAEKLDIFLMYLINYE